MPSASLDALRREIVSLGPVPKHVAIIMDGNGRWASARNRPRIFGHKAGRQSVRECVEGCRELGIEILTLYTFSIENWQRPEAEIKALMTFLKGTLQEEREELRENGVRLGVVGRIHDLPEAVQDALRETIEFLAGGTRLLLNLALSYGGRTELVDAARALGRKIRDREIEPADIDETMMARHLYTSGLPDPDLLIRTSGELRLSNFLLWQLAYSEIWVTDLYWPDFRKEHLYNAVREYLGRDRRFGRVR